MKKVKLLLVYLVFIALNVQAKTIRVNNNLTANPSENLYNNLQTAYDNAVPGDTLLIEGSLDSYEYYLKVKKKLVFIGPGYFLSQNPNTSELKQNAILSRINFETGSEGSKVIGCSFVRNGPSLLIYANNITIESNFFSESSGIQPLIDNLENLTVSKNYFTGNPISIPNGLDGLISFIYINNIALGNFYLSNGTTGIIANNIFKGNIFKVGTQSNSLQIFNNMLLSTSDSASADIELPIGIGSNLNHNISNGQFGTANNNLTGYYESQIFVDSGTDDGKWMIKAGGPAADKGQNGADIGAYGGPTPYKLSGISNVPVIYDLSTDGYSNDDGKINVQLKAKSF